MILDFEDLAYINGYLINGRVICRGCFPNSEYDDENFQLTQDQLLSSEALAENEQIAFCDVCNRRL